VLGNFVAAITHGAPLVAPLEEGRASLELANAMTLSAWEDCAVALPLDADRYARALARRVEDSRGSAHRARRTSAPP
jgi:hypothetical protein